MYSVIKDIERAKQRDADYAFMYTTAHIVGGMVQEGSVRKVPSYGDRFYTYPEMRIMTREHGQAMGSHELGAMRWILPRTNSTEVSKRK